MKIDILLTETPSAMMMQNIWKRMNRRKEIKQVIIEKISPHLMSPHVISEVNPIK